MGDRVESLGVPVAVGLGGALGALLRWLLAQAVTSQESPWATLLTNVMGSLLLGAVLVVGEVVHRPHHRHHGRAWARLWRPFLATGVLGGFTTFSTLVVEANALGAVASALYVVSSICLGLTAYAIGNRAARAVFAVRA